jgi:hypothetical protein
MGGNPAARGAIGLGRPRRLDLLPACGARPFGPSLRAEIHLPFDLSLQHRLGGFAHCAAGNNLKRARWKIAAERRMQLWSFLVVDYDRSGLKFMTWKE